MEQQPLVAEAIRQERHRQNKLIEQGVFRADKDRDDADRLGVLMEEVGEVGKAVHESQGDAALFTELVHVAASAAAWAEGIAA